MLIIVQFQCCIWRVLPYLQPMLILLLHCLLWRMPIILTISIILLYLFQLLIPCVNTPVKIIVLFNHLQCLVIPPSPLNLSSRCCLTHPHQLYLMTTHIHFTLSHCILCKLNIIILCHLVQIDLQCIFQSNWLPSKLRIWAFTSHFRRCSCPLSMRSSMSHSTC